MNNELLKEAIKNRGIAYQFLADKIGVSPQAFSAKINGKYDFRLLEAKTLSEELRLEPDEVMAIFFG